VLCGPDGLWSWCLPDKVEFTPHQRKGNFDVVCTAVWHSRHNSRYICGLLSRPYGLSANRLDGCDRFHLQHEARGGDTRHRDLPEHIGRLEEDGGGYGEAQCLGRFEVDHQLERGGLLDGQVSGLAPFTILFT
jgi:hypothetical protein